MTTRADIVAYLEKFDGYLDGAGYDGANRFSTDEGAGAEAWCGDTVSDTYKQCHLPLPSMQAGHNNGFAYVPSAWAYAGEHNARVSSWQAKPGDLVIFDWNGDGTGDHVELVVKWENGVLHTIGGNSGGSNEPGDHYHGEGGVHRHEWSAPSGQGNAEILGIIDTSKLVKFAADAAPAPKPAPKPAVESTPAWYRRELTQGDKGADVKAAQVRLGLTGPQADGDFGPNTKTALNAFKHAHGLTVDGILGPRAAHLLG